MSPAPAPMLRTLLGLVAVGSLATAQNNVLLIVADDMGVDLVESYGEATDLPPTPNLSRLADFGVTFRQAWGAPRCSPTRAMLQTGRYASSTGIGSNVNEELPEYALQPSELTLPEMIGYGNRTACLGKWHLGSTLVGGELSPNIAGYQFFAGPETAPRKVEEYFQYDKVFNGTVTQEDQYLASNIVDDALSFVGAVQQPWFLNVNFYLPHGPLHTPPTELHSFGEDIQDDRTKLKAMVEAMDTEIGRLLDGIPKAVLKNTTVIFVGDNGTPGILIAPPYDPEKGKGTLYEGGIRVPLIVAGKGVKNPGRDSEQLVTVVDLFQTLADLVEVDTAGVDLDSISFYPILRDESVPVGTLRDYAIAEYFKPNGTNEPVAEMSAIRDRRFKLMRKEDGTEELYDLKLDPYETLNLLDQVAIDPQVQSVYDDLTAELDLVGAAE